MAAQLFVTKDSLTLLINSADPVKKQHIIGRALVALFERQTAAEQSANTTDLHNGVGFAGCDAKSGSLTAKYYLKHKRLEQWQVDRWLTTARGFYRICKYHAQLNEIAQRRAEQKAQQ